MSRTKEDHQHRPTRSASHRFGRRIGTSTLITAKEDSHREIFNQLSEQSDSSDRVWIFLFYLFGLVFFVNTQTLSSWFGWAFAAHVAIGVTTVLIIWRGHQIFLRSQINRYWPVILFLLAAASFSTLWANLRFQEVVTLCAGVLLVIASMGRLTELIKAVWILGLSASIIALVGLVVSEDPTNWATWVGTRQSGSASIGILAALSLSLLPVLFKSTFLPQALLISSVIPLAYASFWFSNSTTASIALLVSGAVAFVFWVVRPRKPFFRYMLTAAVVALPFVVFVPFFRLLVSQFLPKSDSWSGRSVIWSNLIVDSGIVRLNDAVFLKYPDLSNPHHGLIQLAMRIGVPGLILLLPVIFFGFSKLLKYSQFFFWPALYVWIVSMTQSVLWPLSLTGLVFWTILVRASVSMLSWETSHSLPVRASLKVSNAQVIAETSKDCTKSRSYLLLRR